MNLNIMNEPGQSMISKLSFKIFILNYCLCSLPGCISEQNASKRADSQKIDSLINIQKINDRAILVNFGYDAISAINTKQGIVIIDAGISTGLTARYKKVIQDEFKRDDFIYLINTHCHHDHYRGNSVFANSEIVGHVNCPEEISQRSGNQERIIFNLAKTVEDYEQQLQKSNPNTEEWNDLFTQKIRYLNAYLDAKNSEPVKLPDITFSDSLKLDFGDTTIEMIYFGKCHSNSDILIYVPQIKAIFTGDLFSESGRPSINDTLLTDIEIWKRAIRWTENRMINIEKVIDGHGQILSRYDLKQFNNNILSKCAGQ
jgi:glyoxylase-like metal-dependent hydrolase (beta-lactamase superfamily II)